MVNDQFDISYIDRKSGEMRKERVFASRFLMWSYNTLLGSWIMDLFFKCRFVSRLYGWIHKLPLSTPKIIRFVDEMDVDLSECVTPLKDFDSFNDFFKRDIDVSKRITVSDPNVCIAASDGKVLAFQKIDGNRTFTIKRHRFSLRGLLRDDGLANDYEGGSLVISRLALADYHHFHFPASGVPKESDAINGIYNAGGPYALRSLISFYSENYRMLTLIDSKYFDRIAMLEIGALTVGSIYQTYVPGKYVTKGDKKGYFELGGSTVVLLFRENAIQLDQDLIKNTSCGIETYVKFGDSIGSRK